MMQGFYMLALQRRAAKGASPWAACILALACAFFAARAYFAPSAVAANAPLEPYVAYDAGGTLAVSRGGETVLYTEIDTRSLPQADREALGAGVVLPDAEALAKLLEDYSS